MAVPIWNNLDNPSYTPHPLVVKDETDFTACFKEGFLKLFQEAPG
jgi:hypothetical protein